MKNKDSYKLEKKNLKKQKIKFCSNKTIGFELIKDKKKKINGIIITNIRLFKRSFIDYSVNKKIQRKIKKLLELIASVFETDDDPGSQMLMVLNEVERFKRIILNEYALFMTKNQMFLLQKKIELIENEIKFKIKNTPTVIYNEVEEEKEKSGHRRR